MKQGTAYLLLLAAAALLGLSTAPDASALCEVTDSATSDVAISWSEGTWSPGAGCTTFGGGFSTPTPASTTINCASPCPDGWHWSVTLPNGRVVTIAVEGLPSEVTVCVQLFFSQQRGDLRYDIDVEENYIHVFDAVTNELLYNGYWATFNPLNYGFTLVGAQRCGLVHELPTPAETSTWGTIKSLY